ncbi:transcription termination factor Rho [Dissulfurirhabdus thermomarina]|uniref:Transcription termination factor Rho n=1 Tax=Dissulfurirhabdus thermomarina TaxID=1765737 RepID=A0A6N9TUP9_DISTH|nr:Rho termination factor N-terminal domain-containing protein [Dissulfurirhabdus thermomarina]NDY42226.1 transcription termination factor Rho [Dissulfurirhabdus thermomarina]NMX23152.1 transcription termination factor Rho [Dissulfurirhabdus thermomarina]
MSTDKPLEKMTVKELREVAKEIEGLTGVHGMKKDELLAAIRTAKGLEAPAPKAKAAARKKAPKVQLTKKEIQEKIHRLREQAAAALDAKDRRLYEIFRRRASRLKKMTRRIKKG